ncbi:MAG TPA: PEP-CTERM sorting domain-containing protein [Anaerolineae bacterium]|nr:PEP-CTERM sorting domain-containing protein [Anaerolineae bacterium]HIQ05331.1 PEP-CTERM sorting domain-containing protein [Anaerolineae bacterium]
MSIIRRTVTSRWLAPLAALVLVLALTASSILAAGATKRVGLVVRFSDGSTHTEIVEVLADATTFDVLEASTLQVASSDSGFGPAICGLNNDGCPADDCFCDPAHYWAYYHLVGDAWEASMVGVGGYIPTDQSVEGFAWSGFDANYSPTVQPPVMTFAEIEAAAAPAEIPEPATMLLLGGGVAALAGYVRRKRTWHNP